MTTVPESSQSIGRRSKDTTTSEQSETSNQLTSSAEDSPVSPSPTQGDARGRKMPVGSGPSSSESFARLRRDGFWWRMSQVSGRLTKGRRWERFYGTWPFAGTVSNGIAYQRNPLGRGTRETASSLWRTPNRWDGMRGPLSKEKYEDSLKHGTHQINLITQVKHNFFPTPQAMDGQIDPSRISPEARELQLRRNDPHGCRRNTTGSLAKDLAFGIIFPTPRAREGNAGKQGSVGSIHNARRNYLDGVVQEMYPTPRSQDSYERRNWKTIRKVNEEGGDCTLPSKILYKERHGAERPSGQLNPMWVEWLMGFPPGWTDLDASETPSSRKSQK